MKRLLFGILALGFVACGEVPADEASTTEQKTVYATSCFSGENPFLTAYPNRTHCAWQPWTNITPIPSNTAFCNGPVGTNQIDIFDAPFNPGSPPVPPYATADCARLLIASNQYDTAFSYGDVLASGWLTPADTGRWIRSVNAGPGIRYFQSSPTMSYNDGASISNVAFGIAFPFQIPNVQTRYGASWQIAILSARRQ